MGLPDSILDKLPPFEACLSPEVQGRWLDSFDKVAAMIPQLATMEHETDALTELREGIRLGLAVLRHDLGRERRREEPAAGTGEPSPNARGRDGSDDAGGPAAPEDEAAQPPTTRLLTLGTAPVGLDAPVALPPNAWGESRADNSAAAEEEEPPELTAAPPVSPETRGVVQETAGVAPTVGAPEPPTLRGALRLVLQRSADPLTKEVVVERVAALGVTTANKNGLAAAVHQELYDLRGVKVGRDAQDRWFWKAAKPEAGAFAEEHAAEDLAAIQKALQAAALPLRPAEVAERSHVPLTMVPGLLHLLESRKEAQQTSDGRWRWAGGVAATAPEPAEGGHTHIARPTGRKTEEGEWFACDCGHEVFKPFMPAQRRP